MTYVLGVDQGNSKTLAALADSAGQILGVGHAPGGYPTREPEVAMRHLRQAVTGAWSSAGMAAGSAALLCAGLTSADWPDEYALLHKYVMALELAQRVTVVNDAIVALRGGTHLPYGAIVVAGTGTNCGIRTPGGDTFLYHYYVEPELQGGMALGRRALTAVYRAETGREPPTRLRELILDHFACTSVDELLRAECERRLAPQAPKYLAPLLFQAAAAGDGVAQSIVTSFGMGLADLVIAGLRRFGMTELPVEVVTSGSIFKGEGSLLQQVMLAAMAVAVPTVQLVDARYEPVVGAVLLALEELGVVIMAGVSAAVEASSQRHRLLRTLPAVR